MKRKLIFISLFLVIFLLPSCHIGRFFYWNYADLNDCKKFPEAKVMTSTPAFHFFRSEKTVNLTIPKDVILKGDQPASFEQCLEDNKTVAFLVIRNDSIIYERFFDDFNNESVIPSFSVAKSFVSALTGIAIEEGYIKSVNDPMTLYLPEFLEMDRNFEKIRIEDLLNMRSGIKFTESYTSPLYEMPKYYYGTNLNKYMKKLKIKCAPDTEYDYISVNTQLIAEILERSTKKPLNQYLEEKIWKPVGMEFNASWSMDSKKHQQIKSFCCINSHPVDFAKFGRLYLHGGKWGNKQIIPEKWVKRTMTIINDTKDSQGYAYTYQWRVLEDGSIFAKGVLGQFIFVNPEKNIIIVRMGHSPANVHWPKLFEGLVEQL